LEKVESPNFTRTLKYDQFSRVVEANSTIHEEKFTQKTGYRGTADKVDWMQYPSGLSVRNTYDDYGFPQTVEGLSVNSSTYDAFLQASIDLNDSQRNLERWKDQHLTPQALAQLEEHERQVRLLGSTLSEFYDDFADNQARQDKEDHAKRYTDLVELVQQKIEQHTFTAALNQTLIVCVS